MILDALRRAAGAGASLIERPLARYVDLETTDGPSTFATREGDLMDVCRAVGAREMRDAAAAASDLLILDTRLRNAFENLGHSVEFAYVSDPERGREAVARALAGARAAAETLGLNFGPLLAAQEAHVGERARYESLHIAIRTGSALLTGAERSASIARRRAARPAGMPNIASGQNPYAALDALRNRHAGFVSSLIDGFKDTGTILQLLNVHEALKAMYESLWVAETTGAWRARLPGDALPLNMIGERDGRIEDAGALLWPSIGRQLAIHHAERVSPEISRFGRRFVASADIELGPENLESFGYIVNRLWGLGIPFRARFRLASGGARGLGWRHTVALFGALTDKGRKIKNAFDEARYRATSEGCVIWHASFATWASARGEVETRQAELIRTIGGWGKAQARGFTGCSIEGALSSVLGLPGSTAETGFPPLADALAMLPSVAAKPADVGATLYLTPDGALWPVSEGTQDYSCDILIARPRSGKSVELGRKVLGTVLATGTSKLPFIAFLDIGYGSAGPIDLIREGLPPGERHLAAHVKMRADGKFVFNPFQIPEGCRRPPADRRMLIVEFIAQLVRPAERPVGYEGMGELIGSVVDECYRRVDDTVAGAQAVREYSPGTSAVVDAAVRKHEIDVSAGDPGRLLSWYGVSDLLFEAGDYRAWRVAHSHALPQIDDMIEAASADHIVQDYTRTADGGDELRSILIAAVKTCRQSFPMAAGVTTFDPEARVVALDLHEVVGSSANEHGRKTTGVVYILAILALTRGWFLEPRDVLDEAAIPERFRDFHYTQAQEVSGIPKLLVLDEVQQVAKNAPVVSVIENCIRLGPKYRIRTAMACHRMDDIPEAFLDLASSISFLSAQDQSVVDGIAKRYGLTAGIQRAMATTLGQRDERLGRPILIRRATPHGPLMRIVWSSMGPVELWAMSTTPVDVKVRRALIKRAGFEPALRLLATRFPTGSAVEEIAKILSIAIDSRDRSLQTEDAVIRTIIEELVAAEREGFAERSKRLAEVMSGGAGRL